MSPSRPYVPEHLDPDVRWGITRHGLHALIHHVHPIPLCRGFAQSFVEKHWPGLGFKGAMTCATSAGVFKRGAQTFSGLSVAGHVKELHIFGDRSTRVVSFSAEELAERDGDPDRMEFAGGVLVRGDAVVNATREQLLDIARRVKGEP